MNRLRFISFIAGIVVIVCYLVFTLLAYIHYPSTYSPQYNWLSDLGNAYLNPTGAIYYSIGMVVSAGALLLFFLGLAVWKMADRPRQYQLLLMTLGFGILGALALLMSGLYPVDFLSTRSVFVNRWFIPLGIAFAFSVAALFAHPACSRLLLVLGAITAVAAIVNGLLRPAIALEWAAAALSLGYVGLLGAQTTRVTSTNSVRGRAGAGLSAVGFDGGKGK